MEKVQKLGKNKSSFLRKISCGKIPISYNKKERVKKQYEDTRFLL